MAKKSFLKDGRGLGKGHERDDDAIIDPGHDLHGNGLGRGHRHENEPLTFSIPENQTLVTDLDHSYRTGAPDEGVSYSISGGLDATLFTIDPMTGVLSFISAPDFEAPADTDGDNVYELTVRTSANRKGGFVEHKTLVAVGNVNEAPVAADDSFTLAEDSVLNVSALLGLLSNDNDPDDADTLSVTLLTGTSNGSLSLNADGSFTYTPNADFNGSDSFTYSVSDGNGGTSSGTVELEVTAVNDAPVAAGESYATSAGSLPLEVGSVDGVLANDTDADGDDLATVLLTGPANGTLVLDADGSFTYAPSALFQGEVNFTYEVRDGAGGSDTATATITVAPAGAPPAELYTIDEDGVLDVDAANGLLANDPNVPGDPLQAEIVTGPQNGSLALNADGSFSYTPDADFNGSDVFIYSATDSAGVTVQSEVEITVNPVNDAPVYDLSTFRQFANVGQFSIDKVIASIDAIDVDGDGLTFRFEAPEPDAFIFDLDSEVLSDFEAEVQLIGRGTFPNGHPDAGENLFPQGDVSVRALAGPDLLWDVTLFVSDGTVETSIDLTFGTISSG